MFQGHVAGKMVVGTKMAVVIPSHWKYVASCLVTESRASHMLNTLPLPGSLPLKSFDCHRMGERRCYEHQVKRLRMLLVTFYNAMASPPQQRSQIQHKHFNIFIMIVIPNVLFAHQQISCIHSYLCPQSLLSGRLNTHIHTHAHTHTDSRG